MLKKQPCCSLYLQTAKKKTLSLRVYVFKIKRFDEYQTKSRFALK